jgi:hypothetical protein
MAARPSASLSLLLAASAALLGTKPAQAEDTGTHGVGYRFNVYDEDAMSAPVAEGDPRRYHVDTQQFSLDTALGNRDTLNVNAVHEVMSGSSPWYLLPGPGNKPLEVLSGATIRDHRSAVTAALTHDNGGNDTRTFSASYSQERDYHATALGAERTLPLNSVLTLGFGGSFSHDLLRPTDALLFHRVQRAQKNTTSIFGSLSWVLSKDAVIESGVQFNYQSGFLSDPYKLVVVGSTLQDDTRPDSRSEAAWLVRYRYAVNADAALHADARVAANSWGQHSLTLEAAWYQHLHAGWQLIPGLRYYSQDSARFYAPFFDSTNERYFSDDYRLGGFGAVSVNLDVRKHFGHWELNAGAERYRATTNLALGGSDPNPGTVNYTRLFAGLDYQF